MIDVIDDRMRGEYHHSQLLDRNSFSIELNGGTDERVHPQCIDNGEAGSMEADSSGSVQLRSSNLQFNDRSLRAQVLDGIRDRTKKTTGDSKAL